MGSKYGFAPQDVRAYRRNRRGGGLRRKSTRRKSIKRKSIKRKSIKRKSMKRKNTRRRTMKIRKSKLQGGSPTPVELAEKLIIGFKNSKTDADRHQYVSEYMTSREKQQELYLILTELKIMYNRLEPGGTYYSDPLSNAGFTDGVNKEDVKTIFNSILDILKQKEDKDIEAIDLRYHLNRDPLS